MESRLNPEDIIMARILHTARRKGTVFFVTAQSVSVSPVYGDLRKMLFLRIIQEPGFSTVRVCKADAPNY